jgi:hypothetical protein
LHDYLLIQWQSESHDGRLYYLESHDEELCGQFKIRQATLGRDVLWLVLAGDSNETVRIQFQTDTGGYQELRRVLGTMIPFQVLKIEL